jgi:hypothetical protein
MTSSNTLGGGLHFSRYIHPQNNVDNNTLASTVRNRSYFCTSERDVEIYRVKNQIVQCPLVLIQNGIYNLKYLKILSLKSIVQRDLRGIENQAQVISTYWWIIMSPMFYFILIKVTPSREKHKTGFRALLKIQLNLLAEFNVICKRRSLYKQFRNHAYIYRLMTVYVALLFGRQMTIQWSL